MATINKRLQIKYEKFNHTYIVKDRATFKTVLFLILFGGIWCALSLGWRYPLLRVDIAILALITILTMLYLSMEGIGNNKIEINTYDVSVRKFPFGYFGNKSVTLTDIDEFFLSPSYSGKRRLRLKMKSGKSVTLVDSADTWAEAGALKNELNKSLEYFKGQNI